MAFKDVTCSLCSSRGLYFHQVAHEARDCHSIVDVSALGVPLHPHQDAQSGCQDSSSSDSRVVSRVVALTQIRH
eukprot:12883526-Prorocentrum_lima.AAC.1